LLLLLLLLLLLTTRRKTMVVLWRMGLSAAVDNDASESCGDWSWKTVRMIFQREEGTLEGRGSKATRWVSAVPAVAVGSWRNPAGGVGAEK
jgi:hypothetical protein